MTEAELRRLLRAWQKRLGLDHWSLVMHVGGGELEADDMMNVHRSPTYERAAIYVQPWLVGRGEPPPDVFYVAFGKPDSYIETSLVHELLHLAFRDLRAITRSDLDGYLHRDVYDQVEKAAERAEEQAVDRLAEALVRAWPR